MPTIENLAAAETLVLRKIYDAHGAAAFDQAAGHLLVHTAALIAHVCGPQRLRDVMETIAEVHPIQPGHLH